RADPKGGSLGARRGLAPGTSSSEAVSLARRRSAVADAGEGVEGGVVRGDEYAAGGAGGGGDLEVVGSAGAAGPAGGGEQGRVVAGDVDVEGDDVEGLEDRSDGGGAGFAPDAVGELDAGEQLGGGDRRDRDVGVVGDDVDRDRRLAFEPDEDAGVED